LGLKVKHSAPAVWPVSDFAKLGNTSIANYAMEPAKGNNNTIQIHHGNYGRFNNVITKGP